MALLEEVLPALRAGKTIRRSEETEDWKYVDLRIWNGNLRIVSPDGQSSKVDMVTKDLTATDWKVLP